MTLPATKTTTLTATESDKALRLDAFVARALLCGIREAKRHIANGHVLANGKARPPHFKLLPGTTVRISQGQPTVSCLEEAVRVLAVTKDFVVFYKPPELHTAAIAAKKQPSLEQAVTANWNLWRENWPTMATPEYLSLSPQIREAIGNNFQKQPFAACPHTQPLLVNRLDAATSGLVTAAFTAENITQFRRCEALGEVNKYYLAVTSTLPPGPLVLRSALDTDSRIKSRVLEQEAVDVTRHTRVIPLGSAADFLKDAHSGTALVAVCIKRGARHQIRAHLACAGYPLYGDALYGEAAAAPLRLHHIRLVMPGLDAFCMPPWPMRKA